MCERVRTFSPNQWRITEWWLAAWALMSKFCAVCSIQECSCFPAPSSRNCRNWLRHWRSTPNSRHWFMTSFLQPLPYLVRPQGLENCQLTSSFAVVFVVAQTVVRLLQTTQILSDVCFITDHVAYASSNGSSSSFLPGVDALHVYVRAWALGCFHSLIITRTFRRALTASVDSCAEMAEWRN